MAPEVLAAVSCDRGALLPESRGDRNEGKRRVSWVFFSTRENVIGLARAPGVYKRERIEVGVIDEGHCALTCKREGQEIGLYAPLFFAFRLVRMSCCVMGGVWF